MARAETGLLRLIGGRWRGRRLPVPAAPGLRPTPDRVRETLFNWLAPVIAGSRCLDAFAGSGALGLEAASRGAAEVLLLERSPAVVKVLTENLARLQAGQVQMQVELRCADALHWLAVNPPRPFDIVFLDPPFQDDLLGAACGLLATRGWLSPSALIYLEAPRTQDLPDLPPGWEVHRDKQAGQVRYALIARSGGH